MQAHLKNVQKAKKNNDILGVIGDKIATKT
jgi:hypothetical protein